MRVRDGFSPRFAWLLIHFLVDVTVSWPPMMVFLAPGDGFFCPRAKKPSPRAKKQSPRAKKPSPGAKKLSPGAKKPSRAKQIEAHKSVTEPLGGGTKLSRELSGAPGRFFREPPADSRQTPGRPGEPGGGVPQILGPRPKFGARARIWAPDPNLGL